jgi:hypothetical protein
MKIAVFIAFICSIGLCFGQDTLLKAPTIHIHLPKPRPEIINMCATEAYFPGGNKELSKYIQNRLTVVNLNEIDSRSKHKIYISFIVFEDGSVAKVKVDNLDDPIAFKEIEKICTSMPKWIAADHGKGSVKTRIIIPISIVLSDTRYNG